MKTSTSKSSKKRYFPKNYAPARAMALRSGKKSAQVAAKLSLATEKAASATKRTARKLSTSVSKSASTLTRRAKASSSARSTRNTNSSRRVPARRTSRRPVTLSRFTWREITLLSLIGTTASVIIATFILGNTLDPVKRSHHELERLANAYYIEYYYPHSLGKYLDQPETILKDYVEQGLPVVRLRQLLLYNNGQHADSIDVFTNSTYTCDTNSTYVRYYPFEPYGPRDYTLKLYTDGCDFTGSIN